MPSNSANPTKSMFITILKDLGLRSIINKHSMPPLLSAHQFGEALFCLLFAPSCPVVCDPTGVVQKFISEKMLANSEVQVISGAELKADEQIKTNLLRMRASIILDVNC